MTANLTKNEIVSSLHIEPVNTDEYNRNLVKQLASHHKEKFLECIRKERNFLHVPGAYPTLCENLVSELNRHKPKCSQPEWLKIFRTWVECVSSSTLNRFRSKEDKELMAFISMPQPENCYRTTTVSDDRPLNSLSSHCRICLASSRTKMIFLFNNGAMSHQNVDDVTLLQKLNYCSCLMTAATVDDGLPQYICMSCSILIENAYQLKVLCAKTEAKFHQLQQLSVAQKEFEFEQQTKISDTQIERIDDTDLNEVYREDQNTTETEEQRNSNQPNSNENQSKQTPLPVKTGLVDDVNHIEMDDTNGVEQLMVSPTETKSRKRTAQSKNGETGTADGYQCEHCGKWFRVKTSLAIHMRSHTNERPYKCEICGKTFKTSSAANNHRVVHTETKDFKCAECSFRTNTKPNLRLHERTHTRVQPYACKFCTMKFRTASNVVKHTRNIHEKQKTNQCDKCDRSFFTRESLRKHSIIHTNLKPFSCPQCSLSYAWYNGLKKHIQNQHSKEKVKLATEKFFFEKLKNTLP